MDNTDGWISVKDRLPEREIRVLLFMKNEEESLTITGKICTSDDPMLDGEFYVGIDALSPDFLNREYITHWRPLPALPKE